MKKIIGIVSLLFLTLGVQAQPGRAKNPQDRQVQQGRRAERIHAIKVGYLTDRLQLTSSQAEVFWPVYSEYEKELRNARKSFREKHAKAGAETDAQAEQTIEDHLDFQEQALRINRNYKDKLLKTISPQQLVSLYAAERDFKKLLLQQLKERRGAAQGRNGQGIGGQRRGMQHNELR